MRKYKAASWIIAAVLVGGAGVALAETEAEGPSLSGDESGEVIDGGEGTGEVVEGDGDGTEEGGEDGGEIVSTPEDGTIEEGGEEDTEDGDGAHGEHGALVSAAAHDHSHDEVCGNHGKYVSSIARTGTAECATATEGGGDGGGEGGETATAESTKKSSTKSSAKKSGGQGGTKSGGKGGKSGKSGR